MPTDPQDAAQLPARQLTTVSSAPEQPVQHSAAGDPSNVTSPSSQGDEAQRRRIKIGTQRPGIAPPKLPPRTQTRFSTPPPTPLGGTVSLPPPAAREQTPLHGTAPAPLDGSATAPAPPIPDSASLPVATSAEEAPARANPSPDLAADLRPRPAPLASSNAPKRESYPPTGPKIEPPNLRNALSEDLERELAESLGDLSLEEVLNQDQRGKHAGALLESDSRHKARVLRVYRDNVFVELAGLAQGALPVMQFAEPPATGALLDVSVVRYNQEDGLYELSLPSAAAAVGDWSSVAEGMTVEARVTGHNKGGLECDVSNLRGFIPASQASLYRVEDLSQFVGQRFNCIITEANPDKRNLVLSRRAVLEREQAEAKEKLIAELAEGQEREGVVRSLRDFGAFVDLGGVDGMLHVSQLSWQRVKHPSEVLQVGQQIKVKIQKIDPATGKISLSYRDQFENPWKTAAVRYPVTATVSGEVAKIMDFGAFVRVEPGIEGLVHISELSHKRVFRVTDVLKEGQRVEAKVLSVDPDAQRMSLSMKALEARADAKQPTAEEEESEPVAPTNPMPKRTGPLKGGIGRGSGGEQFGLKW